MTTFPGSPKLTKGAIIGFDLLNPLASVIIFQYNPQSLTRSIKARRRKGGCSSGSVAVNPDGHRDSLCRAGTPVSTLRTSWT